MGAHTCAKIIHAFAPPITTLAAVSLPHTPCRCRAASQLTAPTCGRAMLVHMRSAGYVRSASATRYEMIRDVIDYKI